MCKVYTKKESVLQQNDSETFECIHALHQTLWQTLQGNCCLGGALIFKRWCCQSTLSRCTLAHTDGLSEEWQTKTARMREKGLHKKEIEGVDSKRLRYEWKRELQVKNEQIRWGKKEEKNELSFIVTSTSVARPQLPWQKLSGLLAYGVTSIWVLKAGYCFCGADVGGHGKRHSWERCLWPTYRGSSSQLRATILMERHDMKFVALLSLHAWSRILLSLRLYPYSLIAGHFPNDSITGCTLCL